VQGNGLRERLPDQQSRAEQAAIAPEGIVVHNYRWRLSFAAGEPKYDDLEKR
jgi:hypothetical protein